MLVRLSQPHLGPGGELLEAGADLTDNYISEYDTTVNSLSIGTLSLSLFSSRYVIDFVILTAFLQGLSFLTNLVWLFWLVVSTSTITH